MFFLIRWCSLGCAKYWQGSFGFAWVHLDAPSGRRLHLVSRGFNWARLVVTGYIPVRLGSLGCAYLTPGSIRIVWRLVVAGFIRVCVGSVERA